MPPIPPAPGSVRAMPSASSTASRGAGPGPVGVRPGSVARAGRVAIRAAWRAQGAQRGLVCRRGLAGRRGLACRRGFVGGAPYVPPPRCAP